MPYLTWKEFKELVKKLDEAIPDNWYVKSEIKIEIDPQNDTVRFNSQNYKVSRNEK